MATDRMKMKPKLRSPRGDAVSRENLRRSEKASKHSHVSSHSSSLVCVSGQMLLVVDVEQGLGIVFLVLAPVVRIGYGCRCAAGVRA